MGIVESGLNALVEDYGHKIDEQVKKTLDGARQSNAPILLYMWCWLNLIAPQIYTIKHGK